MSLSSEKPTDSPAVESASVATDDYAPAKAPPSPDSAPDSSMQHGVQLAEATAIVWTRKHLVAAYIIIWLIYFVASIEELVVRQLDPFVTSTFSRHSLTATTNVMSSIIAGVTKLPLANLIDTWGRPHGLSLALASWALGFILMATCTNVQMYAAAKVFSAVGSQAVSYCLTIFVADTSSLMHRPVMLAFATSPYIVTPWIGGPINDSIIRSIGWRWGFGIWAIVTPVVVTPLILLFAWNAHKARQLGIVEGHPVDWRPAALYRGAVNMDLLGVLLLAAGMALFLMPFSLYSYQAQSWKSTKIIALIVIGGIVLIAFTVYEAFVAPVRFVPVQLLRDRTVFFGGLMFTFVFMQNMIWGNYFSSTVMLVWNQSVRNTTYISNIYRTGSCFAALIIGMFIRWSRRFKWVALYYGLPLMMLAVGLLIHFRRSDQSIGYIVMTQIFNAIAGGPIVIAGEMAMMAPLDHRHVAAIIAILDLFGSVGTALGSTVAAAMWTGMFKKKLKKYCPAEVNVEFIYGSIYTQLAYKKGTETRTCIDAAYGEMQKWMATASVAVLGGAFGCVVLWRDIVVKKKQVKGTVV